jgi:hypothetical protein
MVAAGERGSNCATTRGRKCRLRLSGTVVEEVELTVVWACGRSEQQRKRWSGRREPNAREWKDPVGTR